MAAYLMYSTLLKMYTSRLMSLDKMPIFKLQNQLLNNLIAYLIRSSKGLDEVEIVVGREQIRVWWIKWDLDLVR